MTATQNDRCDQTDFDIRKVTKSAYTCMSKTGSTKWSIDALFGPVLALQRVFREVSHVSTKTWPNRPIAKLLDVGRQCFHRMRALLIICVDKYACICICICVFRFFVIKKNPDCEHKDIQKMCLRGFVCVPAYF
eukprot:GEMP01102693.1.p1 GENE.GEMP01102693.1~~GEMP01102693.1.p1  ORF type:complete len:134 (+),score=0.16 GEMP01102693.1:125-526(+)